MPSYILYTFQWTNGVQRYFYPAADAAEAQAKGEQLQRIAKQASQPPLFFEFGPLQAALPE